MNENKLKRANEIKNEVERLKAQHVNLSSAIYRRKEDLPCARRFLKLFKSDVERERAEDYAQGIWYWSINEKPERMIELDVHDLELLRDSKAKRIDALQKEFEEM